MKITKNFLVLILIILCSVKSAIILTSSSPCISMSSNGICMKCQNAHMLDNTGNCNQILSSCQQYLNNTNTCISCQQGYTTYKNSCLYTAYMQVYDPFCHSFANKICQQCSYGYYFNSLGRCAASDSNCKTFNIENGQCISCYKGYILQTGTCIIQSNFDEYADFCKDFGNTTQNNKSICVQCNQNYYLNNLFICQPYPLNCDKYDAKLKICTNCLVGYQFNILRKECQLIVGNVSQLINIYCQQWSNYQCIMCYPGFVFDKNNICVIPSNQCKQNSTNGSCLSCYDGWNLTPNFQCAINVNYVYNQLCQSFQNGICFSCSYRSVMNQNGICISINQQCNDFNPINGNCLSCYLGYSLINFTCVIQSSIQPSTSSLCSIFDTIMDICKLCIPRTYLSPSQKICYQVSDQCRTYNNLTGFCTSCYSGYVLNVTNGQCIISNNSNLINCQQFRNDQCTVCLWGFQFDQFHNCINSAAVNSLILNNNITVTQNTNPVNINFCVKYSTNLTCILCETNYQIVNGQCVYVSPYCESFVYNQSTNNSLCEKCYQNYTLVNGTCYSNFQLDSLCQTFNDSICIKCAFRAVFNSLGKCQAVNDLCATWNSQGKCLSCYWGYVVNNGSCIIGQR